MVGAVRRYLPCDRHIPSSPLVVPMPFLEWDDPPLAYAGSAVEALYHSLLLNDRMPSKQKVHQTKSLLAVLCTNVNDVRDLTWELAEQILRKSDAPGQSRDPTSALRDHWRTICRTNEGRVAPESNAFPSWSKTELNLSAPRSSWDSSELVAQLPTCEKFHSPLDPTFTVVFNTDTNPLLLSDVSPSQARELLLSVESSYIADFWDTLSQPSPHELSIPYGLRGSKLHHSLVVPARLFASMSGHCDLNCQESLTALRELTFAELAMGIRAMRPITVQDAHALLTEYGRARLRAASLACGVDSHPTFQKLVDFLIHQATSSGHQTGKSIAQHALIAFRNANWVVLPQSIVNHIGTVLRKLHSFELRALADPLFLLTGGLRDLYKELSRENLETVASSKWKFARKATLAVLCTNVRDRTDFSMPLADRLLSLEGRTLGWATSRERGRARSRWQTVCEENGPNAMLPPLHPNCHRERLSESAPKDARFEPWIDLLSNLMEEQESGNLEPFYTAFSTGCFLNFGCTAGTDGGTTASHLE